ncbi:hypothetical protein F01_200228 [Burkholderia cenocepacia]|nr:hypothetical protein F01_200228 [Burkholderia cenocepacia]
MCAVVEVAAGGALACAMHVEIVKCGNEKRPILAKMTDTRIAVRANRSAQLTGVVAVVDVQDLSGATNLTAVVVGNAKCVKFFDAYAVTRCGARVGHAFATPSG